MGLLDKFIRPIADATALIQKEQRDNREDRALLNTLLAEVCSAQAVISKSGADIDAQRQRYVDQMHRPVDAKDFQLFPDSLFYKDASPADVLPVICFACHAEFKAGAEKGILATWPKTTDPQEKQEQIATITRRMHEREQRIERMICELEKVGGRIDRDPDLNLEIFLEFESASNGIVRNSTICDRAFPPNEIVHTKSTRTFIQLSCSSTSGVRFSKEAAQQPTKRDFNATWTILKLGRKSCSRAVMLSITPTAHAKNCITDVWSF